MIQEKLMKTVLQQQMQLFPNNKLLKLNISQTSKEDIKTKSKKLSTRKDKSQHQELTKSLTPKDKLDGTFRKK
jgi:hypothetical protein